MFSKAKAVLSDSEHRHTVINAAIALAIRVLGAGMAFLFNLIIARQLGAEQSGYFFLALALVMLLSAVARLGFDNTVLRFTSAGVEHGYTVKAILNFALKYVLPVSFIFTVITYTLAPWLAEAVFNKPELTDTLQLITPAIIGLSIVFLVAMSLQARHKLILSIPCQNIAHFMLCGAAVIVLSTDSASTSALYFSLSLGVTSSFFYYLSVKNLNNNGEKPDPQKLWLSAGPNWATVIMNNTIQWLSPLMIGIWLSVENVAYFTIAQRLALLTSFVLMAVNLVVAPKFSQFHSKGNFEGIRKTALFSVRLLLLSSCPIIFIMVCFPEFLMGLFGEDFKKGGYLLQILVIGQFFNVITGSTGHLLMMSGNERDLRDSTILAGIIAILMIPLCTIFFDVTGAAIATATCVALQNLLATFYVKKRLGFNTLMFWQKI